MAALIYLTAVVTLKLSFPQKMKRKTQHSLFNTRDKLKRNRDGTNEGNKLFSFKNIIKISFISSECARNSISSLNTTTCNMRNICQNISKLSLIVSLLKSLMKNPNYRKGSESR